MSNKTDITVQDCLAGAFQALLKGDTHQRDVLCAMAERAFDGKSGSIPSDTVIPLKNITPTTNGE